MGATYIVGEAFQVGVVDGLDRTLKELVDKKKTKTKGRGERRHVKSNIQPYNLSQISLLHFA